jgi:membrane protease YdiL (CAAX protease family)
MPSLARQVATIVWTALLALVLTMLAGGLWSALLVANLQSSPRVPWAVAVMGFLLWIMWQYLGGRWWPESTRLARRRGLRARPVAAPEFAWALVAGGLAIIALAGFWIVLLALVNVHGNPLPDFSLYPPITVVLVIAMASLVTSMAEEAGFRGYLQGMLEQRVGGPLAILITALMLEPGHGTTQGFAWPTMLFYLLVDITFGTAAYLTNSIWPSVVIHAVGLVVFFSLVWPHDPTRHLLDSGAADPWFWIHVAQSLVFGLLAILAFAHLARVTAAARASQKPRAV